MWYVFLCASMAQGILLFAVFVLNRKVRRLCGNICIRKTDSINTSAKTKTKTSIQTVKHSSRVDSDLYHVGKRLSTRVLVVSSS